MSQLLQLTDRKLFEHCYDHIMGWETEKYTNHKGDLGGPTKYGVTLAALSSWRKRKCTAIDVEMMNKSEAYDIYYHMFWKANSCHVVPPAIALCLFDGCVNQNALAMRKYLQMALQTTADGVIGPTTTRLAGQRKQEDTIMKFMALRAVRYSESKTLKLHGLGWYRRMFDTHQKALDLITTRRKEN